jgi:tetratricopeptide (TPR) repeat protein
MALSNKAKAYIKKNSTKSAKDLASHLNQPLSQVEEFLNTPTIKSTDDIEKPSNGSKNLIFTVIALLIPVLFFVSLELGLRWSEYRGNTDLFLKMTSLDNKYKIANPNFASRYFFYTTVVPNAPAEAFLTVKPENGFRVFVMGESSAAGYPYGFNGIFGRVVEDVLQDVMPDRHVEVVTVAMSAINSYTLYDQVDEVLAESPDAIMIYTGHNEFYGALGVGSNESLGSFPAFVRFYLNIQNFKTFLYLRDQLTSIMKWIATSTASSGRSGSETLMQQVVRDQAITLDSPVYDLGKRQFRSNMSEILDKFNKAGVPVFLGSLASNLKDHRPFESIATDQHPAADEVFNQARAAYEQGNFDRAKELFTYARDLDALKFRATTEFNEIIQGLAERDGVYYVPVEEYLVEKSDNGIIGFDLMLEHLHPNSKGYFHIGMAFTKAVRDADFLGFTADVTRWQSEQDYYDRMYLSDFDRRVVDHRLMILTGSWPFVKSGPGFRYNNYQFQSPADSLAFLVVNQNLRWDAAKVKLSEIYLDQGRPDKMINEYRGLMRDQPFNDSPFLIIGQYLLDQGQLNEAEPYMLKAHEINANAYTYKMLGAIQVNRGNYAKGAELLEVSLSMNPNDAQALFNLSGAYAQVGDISKSLEIVNQLLAISPNFPGAQQWKGQLQTIISRQTNR